MEFKQLESFAAVVQYKSFTKAAERLYISQPTISTHIRSLESELGVSLIVRTTKSLDITPNGEKLYDYAQNLLAMRNRMLRECSSEAKNVIHLGVSTIPSAYILPELLPSFRAENPASYFIIHQGDSENAADGVESGIYDIGLVGMNVNRENLISIPFCEDRMVIITPLNDHFLALKQKNAPLEQLLQEAMILRESGSGSKKQADALLEYLHLSEDMLNISARVNDTEAIKNMVAGGLGISVVSERAARNLLAENRLLQFQLPDEVSIRNLYVIYRKDKGIQPHIGKFIDFLTGYYKNQKI